VIDHHAHGHAGGMPATGDDAAIDRFPCCLRIQVEGLRVKSPGKVEHLGLGHQSVAEAGCFTDGVILEPALPPGQGRIVRTNAFTRFADATREECRLGRGPGA
jgi:hypothetical protein